MDQVRWGLLSTAAIGRVVVDAARGAARTRFVAVASRDAGRARQFADDCGLELSFGSYEELLASEDVDAVYVALPVALHAEWTLKALAAGKHVLCEEAVRRHRRRRGPVFRRRGRRRPVVPRGADVPAPPADAASAPPGRGRRGGVELVRNGVAERQPVDPEGTYGLTGAEADVYRIELDTASAVILGEREPGFGREDAVELARVLERVQRSAASGVPVTG